MLIGTGFKSQKTRTVIRSVETRILRFNRETKLTKQCKVIQIFTVKPKRGGTVAPSTHKYATAYVVFIARDIDIASLHVIH